MPKKVQVTIPDELAEWLSSEQKKLSLSASAMIVSLIAETRQNREDKQAIVALGNLVKDMPKETIDKFVAEYMSEKVQGNEQMTF